MRSIPASAGLSLSSYGSPVGREFTDFFRGNSARPLLAHAVRLKRGGGFAGNVLSHIPHLRLGVLVMVSGIFLDVGSSFSLRAVAASDRLDLGAVRLRLAPAAASGLGATFAWLITHCPKWSRSGFSGNSFTELRTSPGADRWYRPGVPGNQLWSRARGRKPAASPGARLRRGPPASARRCPGENGQRRR